MYNVRQNDVSGKPEQIAKAHPSILMGDDEYGSGAKSAGPQRGGKWVDIAISFALGEAGI
jgi:hypothetical protein